jgi:hypothetical protein
LPEYAGPNLCTKITTEGHKMKEKNMANTEQYRAVLDDLMKQRAQLSFRITEIDSAVAALRRLMPPEEISAPKNSQPSLPMAESGKYTGMGVRWAILALLTEDATSPLTTGQIADALQAGGMTSNAKSFSGNVSAVLSGMNHDKQEVVSGSDGWSISEKGRNAWIHIKATRERDAHPIQAASPTLQ